jgi:uncharacterized protein DUF3365
LSAAIERTEADVIVHRRFALTGRRAAGTAGVTSAVVGAALVLAAIMSAPAASRTADEDGQIGKSLATMLSAVRTVISRNQDRINDPNIGNKGLDAKVVLTEASAIYERTSGAAPASIDPNSPHGRLIRMQMDAIAEVMDVHQETINRLGVGFKAFIPAVFARLVNEAFGRRAAGIADMKVTAPPHLIRNPKVQPDDWELDVIRTQLMSGSWPKNQFYSASTEKNGMPAQRMLIPEYYGASCLSCHGSPQGEIDITGFAKEGAKEGDLGGVISITLYR